MPSEMGTYNHCRVSKPLSQHHFRVIEYTRSGVKERRRALSRCDLRGQRGK